MDLHFSMPRKNAAGGMSVDLLTPAGDDVWVKLSTGVSNANVHKKLLYFRSLTGLCRHCENIFTCQATKCCCKPCCRKCAWEMYKRGMCTFCHISNK